jgi:hypothetical protein
MARRRWVMGALCALCAACAMSRALADEPRPVTKQTAQKQTKPQPTREPAAPREEEGYVVEVQEGDLVLDVGGRRLVVGQRVELWRPVAIKHPVSKRVVKDRFYIGDLEITQVRPSLSMARQHSELARAPQAGDIVLVPGSAAPPIADAYPAEAAAEAPAPAASPSNAPAGGEVLSKDTRAVLALFAAMRGATRERRAEEYERFARSHPDSKYRVFLLEEAQALRLADHADEARPQLRSAPREMEARAGEPLRIAIEISGAIGAVLHVRSPRDPAYVTLPMVRVSPDYYAVTIPKERMVAPVLELFIEAVAPDGTASPVFGVPGAPLEAEVRPLPTAEPPSELRTTVKLWTDYADYNRFRGNDYAWQTEGELGMRLSDTGVRAVRSGFGIYRGVGGSVEDLDVRDIPPREVGLAYGYLEGELAPVHAFSIIPRVVVGLGDDGVAGGGQLLFRIGNDLETNLLLGGELLGTVGVRGIAQLELAVFERFPIVFRTEVANQPAGAMPSEGDVAGEGAFALESTDIGARGIVELGFRATDALVLRARGSFQGRTIEHAGPGFGGGVEYSW